MGLHRCASSLVGALPCIVRDGGPVLGATAISAQLAVDFDDSSLPLSHRYRDVSGWRDTPFLVKQDSEARGMVPARWLVSIVAQPSDVTERYGVEALSSQGL